jgi:hypothetical protein
LIISFRTKLKEEGEIIANLKKILYKMHLEKISIEEIMDQPKFDTKTITEII